MTVLRRLRPALAELRAYAPPAPPPIKLDANENPWPLPDDVRAALAQELARVPLHRYPDARAGGLRAALARYLACAPEALVLGAGSDEVISILYNAFGEGRVLFPSPTFVMYEVSARTHGLLPVEVPLAPDWTVDLDGMKRALQQHRPVLAFYARPNNPTGASIPEAALEELIAAAPETLHVVDEAYVAFQRERPEDKPRSLGSWADRFENVAVMGTLSKVGLAGLRVGWLRAAPPLAAALEKVRQPFNLSAVAQEAARLVLERHAHVLEAQVQTIVRERARLTAALTSHSAIAKVWPSAANFVLVRPRDPAPEVAARLREEHGIGVRAFRDEPLRPLLRVTVGTPAESDRLLAAL